MKQESLSILPALQPAHSLIAYNSSKTQRQKPEGIVKLMPPAPPPDEKTISELNRLASTHPFCAFRKARRYDML
ncbi:MAG: hypothetical protein J0H74_29985 [Chitinophagaceae bacterium]|nr:hypothetical protein [Chitinophagaceae bacterium]